MQNPNNLAVYRKATVLAVAVYHATETFPLHEKSGLTSQIRRAAISIGSKVAEGCGRSSDRELAAAFQHAMASASELEFQLRICAALQLGDAVEISELEDAVVEMKKMLSSFIIAVRARRAKRAR